jgi:hypothetical protein
MAKSTTRTTTTALTLVVLVALVALLPLHGDAAGPRKQSRTLEAVGRATVRAAPDTVRVVVAVETRTKTAAQAADANARAATKVSNALNKLVAQDGEVVTSGYSLRARYEYHKPEQRQQLVGYIATNSVSATSSRLDTAGRLIDAAVAAGATSVSSITFSLRDDDAVRRRAVIEAGKRARARVEAIAESLGVEVGELLNATTELAVAERPRPVLARGMASAESSAAATPISAGEIAIEMAVHVVFGVR